MGAWGGLCEFDVRRYREVVVPAFRAGERHPVIASAIALLEPSWECRWEGLAEVMAHFDDDLTTCALGRTFTTPTGWDYELLTPLFEYVVTRETVRSYANLGLTGTWAARVWDAYVDKDDPSLLSELLAELDRSQSGESCYWQHGSGGYGEGIAGWLDAEWTRELAAQVPAPFADSALLLDRQHRFRTVTQRAVEHDNGLLWARDLCLFYSPEEVFADGAEPPVEIPYVG